MTNEDKAFAFANKNADKYINDEDPLGALRDGFLCDAQWKEEQMKSPWHKVANKDLPKHFGYYLVIIDSKRFGRRWAIKCWYGYPEDHFSDNTSKGWALEEDEIVSYWMEIPELPKEEKAI